MAHDSDPFNRWESGQQFAVALLLDMVESIQRGTAPASPDAYIAAVENVIAGADADKALTAQMLTLPGEEYLGNQMQQVDVAAIHQARESLSVSIARALREPLTALYHGNAGNQPYSPDAREAGRRRLRNAALSYLAALDEPETTALCAAQYANADNMTDRIAALDMLSDLDGPERSDALADFYATWKHDPIVTDKWLSIQAVSSQPGTLDAVVGLLEHDAFSIRNPNRVRALIGALLQQQPAAVSRSRRARLRLSRRPSAPSRPAQPTGRGAAAGPARSVAPFRRTAAGLDENTVAARSRYGQPSIHGRL